MPRLNSISPVVMLLLVSVLTLAGCTRVTGASVAGNITLDGAPLDDANISFVSQGGGQSDAGWATVKNGEFTIPATLGAGSFRVEIRALRGSGDLNSASDLPVFAKEIIPERYNSKSELSADLKPGVNNVKFELKSK